MASSEQQLKHIAEASEDTVQRLAPTVNGGAGPVTLARPRGARRSLPQLPIEAWENVIDHLWDDQHTLLECIFVCRAWYPPCRFHLHRKIRIQSVEDVKAYAKMLEQTPELSKRAHDMFIMGGFYFRECGTESYQEYRPEWIYLLTLWPAAIMLAPKLPRLEQLTIYGSVWQPSAMHSEIFLYLSAFSVTRLHLDMVTFPSLAVFGRLVSALPALVELKLCNYLVFIHDHFHPDAFGLFENRVKIRSLWLEPSERLSETLIDFLAHPSISGHLRRLILNNAAYDDPFTKRQTQQMLKIASGSLLDL